MEIKKSELEIKAAIQIQKPIEQVFEAIVESDKMASYFISKSTGKMEEGKNLVWNFPEFDVDCPIRVGKIEENKYISYYWDGAEKRELFVEISLTEFENHSTIVTVTEKFMPNDEIGIKWLKGNTEGWSNFLCCLKAYLEYGINLRKGSFDFKSDKKQ